MLFEIRNPVLRTLVGIVVLCVGIFGIPYAAGLLGNLAHPTFYPEGMFIIWLTGWLWLIGAAVVATVLFVLGMFGYEVGVVLFGK